MPKSIRLLSGGAAQGLVKATEDRFAAENGYAINASFGAVGAMRDKLLAGEGCDLMILTQALVRQLVAAGHLVAGSERDIGRVMTGVAVKAGEAAPDIATGAQLRASLLAAPAIHIPDPLLATAGIHFARVLKTLGIEAEMATRLRPSPNGAAAMRELAQTNQTGHLGCTQVTEILFAPGVRLVGLLPPEFELATVYTAAVCTRAAEPGAAAALVQMLADPQAAEARTAAGFEML